MTGMTDAVSQAQRSSSGIGPPMEGYVIPRTLRLGQVWRWITATPRRAARGLVTLYRYTFSPLVGFHCRHLPTCSEYADEALARHGLWAGGWMTLARLCRCHPLGSSGLDFVPASRPPRSRWYLPWRYGRWRGTNDQPDPSATSSASTIVIDNRT
jgi:putative membrane protein insertion efficiency factor